ncbi:MAG: hypothetical protein ABFC38_00305 [Methanospirillum sp.]
MKSHLFYVVCAVVLIGSLGVPPAVAADQGSIAYMAIPGLNEDIYVMNADGTGPTRLTVNEQFDSWPSWSPDGSRVVYVHEPVDSAAGNSMEIYVMNADVSNPTRLTVNNAIDYMPSWSPDGSRIAFISNRAYEAAGYDYSSPCDIYVMNADGTNPTRLTTHGVSSRLSWSPDGSRIAYSDGGIWVMKADGTSPTFLVDGSQPAWSPDGTRIAFTVWQTSADRVLMMKADGTNPTFLVDGSYPAWSPNSGMVAFVRGDDIYRINTDGTGEIGLTTSHTYGNVKDAPAWGGPDTSGTITPRTPAEATWDLRAQVSSLGLPTAVRTGLTDKMDATVGALNKDSKKTAINNLNAFINLAKAQRGKGLTAAQTNALIAEAQKIITSI